MRLIDADAEIAKIEQEIQKIKSRIKEWEENREDRSGCHDVDGKISQFKSNILQAQTEIECLKRYSTTYDIDKVVERLEARLLKIKKQLIYAHDEDLVVRLKCKKHDLEEALEIVKSGGIE